MELVLCTALSFPAPTLSLHETLPRFSEFGFAVRYRQGIMDWVLKIVTSAGSYDKYDSMS